MRKLYFLFAVILLAGSLANASVLNLRMSNNASFMITIDGQSMGSANNTFRIEPITGGRHIVNVSQQGPNDMYGHSRMITVFNNAVDINEGMELFGVIDPRTGFSVSRIVALQKNDEEYNDGQNDQNYGYDYRAGDPRNNRKGGHGNNNYNRNNNNANKNYGRIMYMNNRDFDALKCAVNNTPFDRTKKMIAEQAIRSNPMSVYQLKELLQLFTFESSKLHLAKIGYDYSPDRNKYFIINDVFAFSSSIEDLNRYILLHR